MSMTATNDTATNDTATIQKIDLPDQMFHHIKKLVIVFINPEYTEQFAKAFKNAVILCGGKPSAF